MVEKLNLERIYCGTASGNMGMQRLALRMGMIEEGVGASTFFSMVAGMT